MSSAQCQPKEARAETCWVSSFFQIRPTLKITPPPPITSGPGYNVAAYLAVRKGSSVAIYTEQNRERGSRLKPGLGERPA